MSIEQSIANHRGFVPSDSLSRPPFCLSCLFQIRFEKLDSGIYGVLGWATKYCGWGDNSKIIGSKNGGVGGDGVK